MLDQCTIIWHKMWADDFIIAMCNLIQRLTIDSLHIVVIYTTVVPERTSSWIRCAITTTSTFNGNQYDIPDGAGFR